MNPEDALARFGDLDHRLYEIYVHLFYRSGTSPQRPILESAIIQYYYDLDDYCQEGEVIGSPHQMILYAQDLFHRSQTWLEFTPYPVNPLHHPVRSFSWWIRFIFRFILTIRVPTESAIGITFQGITTWGTRASISLIREPGGDRKGTDYNAIFFEN